MCSVSSYVNFPGFHPSQLSVLLHSAIVLLLGGLGPVVAISSVCRDSIDGAIEVCTMGMGVLLVGMARGCVKKTYTS